MSDKALKTAFTDGLAEALRAEPGVAVLIRDREGRLHALTEAAVTRIVGPDGVERTVMVLQTGEGEAGPGDPGELN